MNHKKEEQLCFVHNTVMFLITWLGIVNRNKYVYEHIAVPIDDTYIILLVTREENTISDETGSKKRRNNNKEKHRKEANKVQGGNRYKMFNIKTS